MTNYNPIYYEQNKKRIIAAQTKYQQANKDKVNAKQRRYYIKHKDEINRKRREKREKYKKITVIHDIDEAVISENNNK